MWPLEVPIQLSIPHAVWPLEVGIQLSIQQRNVAVGGDI